MRIAKESELVSTAKDREVLNIRKEREFLGTEKRGNSWASQKRGSSCPQAAVLAHSPCLLLQELYIETIEKVDCPCQFLSIKH